MIAEREFLQFLFVDRVSTLVNLSSFREPTIYPSGVVVWEEVSLEKWRSPQWKWGETNVELDEIKLGGLSQIMSLRSKLTYGGSNDPC